MLASVYIFVYVQEDVTCCCSVDYYFFLFMVFMKVIFYSFLILKKADALTL